MGDLFFDSLQTETNLKFATKKADLIIESKDAQLDEWFRKWYLTIPLGILIGGATGTAVFLLK